MVVYWFDESKKPHVTGMIKKFYAYQIKRSIQQEFSYDSSLLLVQKYLNYFGLKLEAKRQSWQHLLFF